MGNGKDKPPPVAVKLDGVYFLMETPDGYMVVVTQDGSVVGNVAPKGFAALDRLFYFHVAKLQALYDYPNPSKEQADEVKQRYLNKLADGWKDKVSEAIKEVMDDDDWKKKPAWDYDKELTGKATRRDIVLTGISAYEKEDEDESETDTDEEDS